MLDFAKEALEHSPRRMCGIELFMAMEKDFREAKEKGTMEAIDNFVRKWNCFWIEEK